MDRGGVPGISADGPGQQQVDPRWQVGQPRPGADVAEDSHVSFGYAALDRVPGHTALGYRQLRDLVRRAEQRPRDVCVAAPTVVRRGLRVSFGTAQPVAVALA